MTDKDSMVSVVIPTHNYGAYITEAIQSVLAQTYHVHEIIVVDDGSTDRTEEILLPYMGRITYIRQNQRGPSAARNVGLKRSRGEFIAFLDADDQWLPDKLSVQVGLLREYQEVGLLFGQVEHCDDAGRALSGELTPAKGAIPMRTDVMVKDAFRLLLESCYIVTSTVIIRRECIERVGGFDESLRSVEDRDLWLRIAGSFQFGYTPRVVACKRGHANNVSGDSRLQMESHVRMLEALAHRADLPVNRHVELIRARLGCLYYRLGTSFFFADDFHQAKKHFQSSLRNQIKLVPLVFFLTTFLNKLTIRRIVTMKRRFNRAMGYVMRSPVNLNQEPCTFDARKVGRRS
jgi:glycosyltransferase involved in cell wall biosynthesis